MLQKLPYGLGIFLIIAGVASVTQSINPSFLIQADAASIEVSKASIVMAVIGSILFALGFLVVIIKILKGKEKHG